MQMRQFDFSLVNRLAERTQPDNDTAKAQGDFSMAGGSIPHFQNDAGHPAIEIGAKEFMCVGANPPYDHPHVFLDMGSDSEKVCPYCSTLFRYNHDLTADQTNPAGCLYLDRAA
jgi:uncharacterized Zn-finger protein